MIITCLATTTIFLACNLEAKNESQYRTVIISFEGKNFDDLRIRPFTIYREDPIIHGTTTDGYHWTFLVPDSIIAISRFFNFRSRSDSLDALFGLGTHSFPNTHSIGFQSVINGDTLRGNRFHFDKDETIMELTATFDTTTWFNNTHHIAELDTTIILQTLVSHRFTIPLPQNKFLRESMQMPNFGRFWDRNNPDKTHEEFLTTYANWIRENPNSLYLMTELSSPSRNFESKEDYEYLLSLFSPEMQNSMWGVMARRFLRPFNLEGIATISLPNSLTREYEKIILDPTKHTLLCISASWCPPCIRAIPMLKEIHEATRGRLNLVYISTDDRTTIANWNALMERENITWRSLWLTNQDLLTDWQIRGIPDYILVAPNGEARKISLRTDEDIQELFSILGM